MGSCLSKKEPPPPSPPPPEPEKPISRSEPDEKAPPAKREIFVIKHRRSHEIPEKTDPVSDSGMTSSESGQNLIASNINLILNGTGPPRASSCTKEEVDAILIQCGRLSRSSSGAARKYSGSKRSYDFDNDGVAGGGVGDEEDDGSLEKRVHGRSRVSSPQGSRRRRTPSRERDQRSNSRERNINGGGSRRVSRSPGRRSENNSSTTNNGNGNANSNNKPGKMVSVPATVTSLTGAGAGAGEPVIKRVTVRRNVSSPARARSPAKGYTNGPSENPRAWSPARTNPNPSGSGENPRARSPARMNQNGSTENHRAWSPARTNENHQQQALGRSSSRKGEQSPFRRNPLSEIDPNSLAYPQPLTRSRSSRRSQDLDFNTEALLNPNPSYTSLLLEDIQNFHQKNTNSQMPPASFSLPACVTKACSIVEAVADLNSGTSSGLTDQISGKRRQIQQQRQPKCPFVESEVAIIDDLMEPSFQKYVTVSRGGAIEEEEESSGSNSVVCGNSRQQHRGISNSSSWEPTSADSTDRSREIEEARREFSGKRRDFDHHGNRGPRSLTVAAAAAST